MNNKVIILVLVIITSGLFYFFNMQNNYEFEPIENADSSKGLSVGALGRIEPSSKVLNLYDDSGPEVSIVSALHVSEGDEVKAGDVLVTFTSNKRRDAELDLAKVNVTNLIEKVKLQEVSYKIAEKEYQRYSILLKERSISVDAKDKAYIALNKATSLLTSLKSELESAKIKVIMAENELSRTYIKSPIDATILKINSYVGEKVSPMGIIEIADLNNFDVVAEIYERDISKVKKEQKAEVFIDGIKKPLEGVIKDIGFQVYKNDVNQTDPLSNRDNRVVEVRIDIAKNDSVDLIKHMIYRQVQVRILP